VLGRVVDGNERATLTQPSRHVEDVKDVVVTLLVKANTGSSSSL